MWIWMFGLMLQVELHWFTAGWLSLCCAVGVRADHIQTEQPDHVGLLESIGVYVSVTNGNEVQVPFLACMSVTYHFSHAVSMLATAVRLGEIHIVSQTAHCLWELLLQVSVRWGSNCWPPQKQHPLCYEVTMQSSKPEVACVSVKRTFCQTCSGIQRLQTFVLTSHTFVGGIPNQHCRKSVSAHSRWTWDKHCNCVNAACRVAWNGSGGQTTTANCWVDGNHPFDQDIPPMDRLIHCLLLCHCLLLVSSGKAASSRAAWSWPCTQRLAAFY